MPEPSMSRKDLHLERMFETLARSARVAVCRLCSRRRHGNPPWSWPSISICRTMLAEAMRLGVGEVRADDRPVVAAVDSSKRGERRPTTLLRPESARRVLVDRRLLGEWSSAPRYAVPPKVGRRRRAPARSARLMSCSARHRRRVVTAAVEHHEAGRPGTIAARLGHPPLVVRPAQRAVAEDHRQPQLVRDATAG